MANLYCIVVLVIVVLIQRGAQGQTSGCVLPPNPVPLPQSSLDAIFAQLEPIFEQLFKHTGMPGMSAVATYRDKVVWMMQRGTRTW
jgi:hypothetical protein